MATAKKGDQVRVHYVGTLPDGTEFDTSAGQDPLDFKIGGGDLLPAFEEAIVGMTVGEKKTIKIPADQAYGKHRPELVQKVERSRLSKEIALEQGMQLGADGPDGQEVVVTVVELSDEVVTIDANHPLAGKELKFDLELMAINS